MKDVAPNVIPFYAEASVIKDFAPGNLHVGMNGERDAADHVREMAQFVELKISGAIPAANVPADSASDIIGIRGSPQVQLPPKRCIGKRAIERMHRDGKVMQCNGRVG